MGGQLFHLEVVLVEEQEAQCVPKYVLDAVVENGELFLQVVHQGALHLGQYLLKIRKFIRYSKNWRKFHDDTELLNQCSYELNDKLYNLMTLIIYLMCT